MNTDKISVFYLFVTEHCSIFASTNNTNTTNIEKVLVFQSDQIIILYMKRINLKTYYKTCKKKYEFAGKVAERCDVTLNAVINWCNFYARPGDEIKMQILSEESGIPIEDLFNRELA